MPFYPFGPPPVHRDGNNNNPAMPGPDHVVAMARQMGFIPPFVGDEDIMVVGMTVTGGMEFLGIPGGRTSDVVRWRSGDQLPHTSRDFSDPPFMVNPGDWRDKLIGSVESIENDEDADEFRLALMTQLSYDLVHSHDVPSEMAVDGAGEFADWLIATYRKSP